MAQQHTRLTILALGLLGCPASGQVEEEIPPPTVSEPPIRIEPTIVAPTILTSTRAVIPGQPTPSDAVPGLLGEDIAVPLARLLPEGAFLTQRVGGLIRARTGEWIFISSADEAGRRDPPLVLLPSATLQELENRIAGDATGVRVVLSGQVFVYHDRNYLMPTLFAITREQPSASGRDPEDPTDESPDGDAPAEHPAAPSDPPDQPPIDPRVANLLEQLEQEGRLTEGLDRPAPPTNAQRADAMLNDGRLVIRQRGRVTRLINGRLALSFDQDDAAREPIILLPSSTLAEMESAIARTGESRPIILSGRHYVHNGRRYLLPISFLLATPSELKPMQ